MISCPNRRAKINVKVLVILVVAVAALGGGLFAARQIRRSILSKRALVAAEAAFAKGDYKTASREYQEYLGRNPDDIEILRRYAKARLGIRPLEGANILQAIAGYRRVLQLDPEDGAAREKLAMLYTGIGNFEELAYIARMRLDRAPGDRQAQLWLAEGLIQLKKLKEARETLDGLVAGIEASPGRHVEFVRACSLLSQIEGQDNSSGAKARALEWLNRAAAYDPNSVEALAYRAGFYRKTPVTPGVEQPMAAARRDLEAADALGTDDPKLRLFLATEWLAHGEWDRAEAELRACESMTPEAVEEHFFDAQDWAVAKFRIVSQLTMYRGTPAEQGGLADEMLGTLTELRHRLQVLPAAVQLYCMAGRPSDARKSLDEYLSSRYTQGRAGEPQSMIAYLRAMVAQAEGNAYGVIEALQPVIVSDASRPDLWRLLAEAYSRTDQTRRAVSALVSYLRLRPRDPQMTLQLAREYLKLRDWNRAFETARMAEPLDPTDIILRLLRIEASIYIAAEQAQQTINKARLAELSAELADLREKHPDRVDIRILQAIIAVYLEQPEQAEKELKLAIEECDEPLRAEMQLVRHYYRTERMAEAIDLCRMSCDKHPEVSEPWLSLSGLYVADANHDLARDCLRKGLDAVTGKWEMRAVTIRLALLELMHGDRNAGIRLLSDLAAGDEHEVYARSLLLGVSEIQQDRARALGVIGDLRKAEGESGLSWRFYEASLRLASEDWRSQQQEIRTQLQYCVDADPEWPAPVLLLVDLYERLEEPQRVEDLCRQALARNPSATEIADKLVTLLEKQGRFSDAEHVLQQIEADSRVASNWHVRSALRAGDFSRAIDELKLRVDNDKQDVNSRILLARLIYWQNRDARQAFEYLRQAEEIEASSMALTAVRVAILRAEGQLQEAQRILDEHVANRSDFESYLMRGIHFANQGDLARAEEDYRKLTTFADRGVVAYDVLSSFYARSGKLDRAIAALEEGLKAHPDDVRLRRQLMKALFLPGDTRDLARASALLEKLRQELPQDPELMKIGALQTLQDATPESIATARDLLERVIKLEPTAVDAHLALIHIAMVEGRAEVARDHAIRALGPNPSDPLLLTARGRAELALGNPQMAAELVSMVLQTDPNHLGAIEILVTAALNTQDKSLLEKACTFLDPVAARDPGNERLQLARARMLVLLGRPKDGIPALETYVRTEPGSRSVEAVVMLADLYRLSGDAEQAGRRIEQVEQIDPNGQTAIYARLLLLLSQKRFSDLEGISAAFLAAQRQEPAILMTAASTLAAQNSTSLKKEGLKLFEHLVSLSPTSLDAQASLASTLYLVGDADRAKKIYGDLLKQQPKNARVLNDLAWILHEHDHEYDKALELADAGLQYAPSDLDLLDTRGTIQTHISGRLGNARSDFERLVNLAPADTSRRAKALLQLGRVCAKLNDLAAARQHLTNALNIDRKIDVFSPDERAEIQRLLQSGDGR